MNLNELVITPASRVFHLADSEIGLLDRVDSEKEADLSLEIQFLDKKAINKIRDSCLSRKPVSSKGMKALVGADDLFRERLVKKALVGWTLSKRGLKALQSQMDLSKLDDDEAIPFTDANVEALIKHSNLPGEVSAILNDHEAWFGIDEDHLSPEDEDDAQGN